MARLASPGFSAPKASTSPSWAQKTARFFRRAFPSRVRARRLLARLALASPDGAETLGRFLIGSQARARESGQRFFLDKTVWEWAFDLASHAPRARPRAIEAALAEGFSTRRFLASNGSGSQATGPTLAFSMNDNGWSRIVRLAGDDALGQLLSKRKLRRGRSEAQENALMIAASSGNPARARRFLPWFPLAETDFRGQTALHHAVLGGNLEVARLLLRGADPSARDANGLTPFLLAAFLGSAPMLALLAPLSDLELADAHGRNALGLAAHEGRSEAVAFLLGRYAPGNRSPNGQAVDDAQKAGADFWERTARECAGRSPFANARLAEHSRLAALLRARRLSDEIRGDLGFGLDPSAPRGEPSPSRPSRRL